LECVLPLDDVITLVKDIKNKNLAPIYLLMGEEAYYIDKISDYIEANVLAETEKGFNQMVLYGRDVTIENIVANAKRFPMMADKQVIIVKEAQDLWRTIDNLNDYAKNPQPSTVLVLCFKYKKLDKRKTIYKTIKKNGVIFESKKLYDNQVLDWIRRTLSTKGYKITPKAAQMLVEFLGTNLSKINNELEKLQIVLPQGSEISPLHIEKNIGISKDYNNFELQKAIGARNEAKAFKIVNYFGDNPKDNPMVVTVSIVFRFFSQLLQLHGMNDKSPRSVASALRVNPYFVSDYLEAARHFPMRKVSGIIAIIREFDLKCKGVNSNAVPQKGLLKEFLAKIFN